MKNGNNNQRKGKGKQQSQPVVSTKRGQSPSDRAQQARSAANKARHLAQESLRQKRFAEAARTRREARAAKKLAQQIAEANAFEASIEEQLRVLVHLQTVHPEAKLPDHHAMQMVERWHIQQATRAARVQRLRAEFEQTKRFG